MVNVLISLGSSRRVGRFSPAQIVLRAADSVAGLGEGMTLSPLYRSESWPDASMPAYVNAVLQMTTLAGPEELLYSLLAIEAGFSRVRSNDAEKRYAPRTLDLDLLDHGGLILDSEGLTLPHPRLHERAFVLTPLADVASEWRHPVLGKTAQDMASVMGPSGVSRLPFTGALPAQA
ncbi:MAG: 2-amino-4-hydroxy-6-hydroxymethyldihydropteridine diphosphokinase [Pseudomonadota bacterium]